MLQLFWILFQKYYDFCGIYFKNIALRQWNKVFFLIAFR